MQSHLSEFEGDLYDTRLGFGEGAIVRRNYCRHHPTIESLADLKATLRAGPRVWPGCYPLYLITHDGAALSFKTAREEFRQIAWDFLANASTGWRVVACDINYEYSDLYDDHSGEHIPSAYGDDNT